MNQQVALSLEAPQASLTGLGSVRVGEENEVPSVSNLTVFASRYPPFLTDAAWRSRSEVRAAVLGRKPEEGR